MNEYIILIIVIVVQTVVYEKIPLVISFQNLFS